jgi:anti-sigma-K factor RskA
MYDDDRDALAAEYVLGTLSTDERDQAEALLAIDPGFAEIVRVWERRLGELNVMVEAVDPPPEVWQRIKAELDGDGRHGEAALPPSAAVSPPHAPEPPPEMASDPELGLVPEPPRDLDLPEPPRDLDLDRPEPPRDLDLPEPPRDLDLDRPEPPQDLDALMVPHDLDANEPPQDADESSPIAALASSLLPPDKESPPHDPFLAEPPPPQTAGRSADIIVLARRARRWRRLTVAMSAIAALLAVYVAVDQFAPGLIPLYRQPPAAVAGRTQPPNDRLVAVLAQEPTAPAFLVTVDAQSRTLTVRRVSATPEAGRSYELWLISSKFGSPRSLGVVGGEEFTTRALPANFDRDTVRAASYAVSLEPAGGSPTGAPTGPILFTGKMVESLPGSLPPG